MMMYLSMIETPADRDKFEQIYLKYRKLMFHVANKILKNPHDSEDAVQQAFVSIIKNLEMFSEIECHKTRSSIVLITERKAIDIIRTSHRDKLLPLNEDINGITIPLPGDMGIADAMARLPSRYREILLLKFDNGLLSGVNKVQVYLLKLADAELAAGETGKAKHITQIHGDMVTLFELWECSAYGAALSLAMEIKDKEQILPLLQGIIRTAQHPWDMSVTCLYHRIADTGKKSVDKAMPSALLHSVAQCAGTGFLRDDPRFQSISEECDQILARDF